MSQSYLATIEDDGVFLVRARDGSIHNRGTDLSLDGLDAGGLRPRRDQARPGR